MLAYRRSPIKWVKDFLGLVPQPIDPAYSDRFMEICSLTWGEWEKAKNEVDESWFRGFIRGKHITWQQYMVLIGIEKALKGEASLRITVKAGHGVGKGLTYSTNVPFVNGFIQWKDVVVGTELIDEHGEPVTVIGTNPLTNVPFYKVSFDDGSSCDVSSGHLWSVRGRQDRRKKLDSWRTMETIDILEQGVLRSNGKSKARQWEIPIQGAVKWDGKETDLPHYFMGLWLAEGYKNRISTTQTEVIEYLEGNFKTSKNNDTVSISNIFDKTIERKNMRSTTKYIPEEYKYGSVQQRRDLLAGLLDGDGECQKNGTVLYSSTSKQLIEDVTGVARSLGYKVHSPTSKIGKYKKDGVIHECNECFRIVITAYENPFQLSTHKKERWHKPAGRYLKRWITSIEPIGDKDGMCVEVDSPTGLHLSNDYVVTHNSALESWVLLWWLFCWKDSQVGCTAPTSEQMDDVLWKEVQVWLNRIRERDQEAASLYDWQSGYVRMVESPETWFARARTARKEKPEALAGLHGEHVCILVDEASGIVDEIYNTIEGSLTSGKILVIMISNPTRLTGYFYDSHNRDKEAHQRYSFDSRQSPIVDWNYVNRIKTKFGEDDDEFKIRVEGNFPNAEALDEKGYVPLILDNQIVQTIDRGFSGRVRMGIDPAGDGKDKTVWVIRDKFKAEVVASEEKSTDKTIAAKTFTLMAEYGVLPEDTFMDTFGIGADCIAEINATLPAGKGIISCNVGKQPESDEDKARFLNMRTQAYWRLRDWLISGGELVMHKGWEELEYMKQRRNHGNKIQVMPKRDMKKDLGKSPDHIDALMVTFITEWFDEDYIDNDYSYSATAGTDVDAGSLA